MKTKTAASRSRQACCEWQLTGCQSQSLFRVGFREKLNALAFASNQSSGKVLVVKKGRGRVSRKKGRGAERRLDWCRSGLRNRCQFLRTVKFSPGRVFASWGRKKVDQSSRIIPFQCHSRVGTFSWHSMGRPRLQNWGQIFFPALLCENMSFANIATKTPPTMLFSRKLDTLNPFVGVVANNPSYKSCKDRCENMSVFVKTRLFSGQNKVFL